MSITAYTLFHNDEDAMIAGTLEVGDWFGDSDLYEASISIKVFATRSEAEAWLDEQQEEFDLLHGGD